jgi:hypothetical protein
MEIKDQNNIDGFAVVAGVELEFEPAIMTLSFRAGEKLVKLNKEECEELLKVLNGKCHKIYAFENVDAYGPHSAIFSSCGDGEEPTEGVIYHDKTIARF